MRKFFYSALALCLIVVGVSLQPDLAAATTPKIAIAVAPAQAPSSLASVSLSATVKNGKAGQRVTVERRNASKGGWTKVRTLTLPASLKIKLGVTPKLGENYFRVRVARKGSTKAATSGSAAVTGLIAVNPIRPNAGKKASYSGELPTSFKRTAQLQVQQGTKWRTLQSVKSKSHGKISFSVALKAKSTLRVHVPKVRYKHKNRAAFTSPAITVDPLLPQNPKVDTDKDKLPDFIEQRLGTSLAKADSDGDGLTDEQEVLASTDPTKKDTDGDGVLDPADDIDGDGVTNKVELADGTKAYEPDTDGDTLNDGAEKKRRTNPLKADTDGDGVSDAIEVKLGTNPLKADSDGDGTADGKESFTRDVKADKGGATFQAEGSAKAVATATVSQLPSTTFSGITGGLGAGVEVKSAAKLDAGVLTVPFDTSTLPAGANVGVLHFNESTGTFDQPADQDVDLAAGTVTVRTTSFSPFIVVNLDDFKEIWKKEIVVPREGNGQTTQNVDAVLALDSSGSMADNDPSGDRKVAAKSFVDALIAGDRASALDFDSMVEQIEHLTTDFTAVKALIDSIDDFGGTDIGAAVQGGLDELDQNGASSHGRIIVLLTDGDGPYNTSLTTRAAASKTTIYTVGLGVGVDASLLQGIADGTGGKYFQVADSGQLPGAFNRIIGDIGAPDTDGDGLSDDAETTGWRTQRGAVYKTDPKKADTDGDGLTDGEEAGPLTEGKFGKAYASTSNPLVKNSDADSLNDGDELALGTDAMRTDTDADGLSDSAELNFGSDPTLMNPDGDTYLDDDELRLGLDPLAYDLTRDERTAALLGGAIFGDWTWGAEHVGRMNQAQMQSGDYILGQFASGVLVIGDIRDLATNIGEGNFWGAVLSGAAFIPAFGDVGKLATDLARFAKRGKEAEQSAFRLIEKSPLSSSAKKSLVGRVFGTGVKVFPKALEGGPTDTFVYYGVRDGKQVYVGITNDIARRAAQHGDRFKLSKITDSPVTRGRARAIEEALIVRNGTKFENKIHSISQSHPYYKEAVAWGEDWLKSHP